MEHSIPVPIFFFQALTFHQISMAFLPPLYNNAFNPSTPCPFYHTPSIPLYPKVVPIITGAAQTHTDRLRRAASVRKSWLIRHEDEACIHGHLPRDGWDIGYLCRVEKGSIAVYQLGEDGSEEWRGLPGEHHHG